MSGRYISGKLIKSVQSGGKNVAIEYVEKTSSWIRPSGFPSRSVQDDFVKVAQNNLSKFKAGTVKIAMKYVFELRLVVFWSRYLHRDRESEHQSSDTKHHYTAYGIDAKGDVIDVKHLYK
jgi:hypothetical protein